MSLNELNSAARVREAIIKVAQETVEQERPRARYATVISRDQTARTLVVQYPDEASTFTVPCGALMPLANGQVVRIAGLMGDRYVDDIIGQASFDGNIGTAETFVDANQTAMLAHTNAKRGDVSVRTDINKSFILKALPSSTLGNWQELLTADATAAANSVMSVHLAAADPHTQYLTQAEGDALYGGSTAINAAIAAHAALADPHTGYVLEAGGSQILASGTNIIPLSIRGAVSQVADLQQWVDGGGVTKVWITAAGELSGAASGLTGLNATNIASGTLASARLPATIAATTTGTAAAWTTARTLSLTGAITGSASIDGTGNVSLTTTNATGLLLAGGTMTGTLTARSGSSAAGTAPIKLVAGTNMTAAEAGAVEWDGTSLYVTQTTGPTRKTVAYIDSALTGSVAKWTTARTITLGGDLTGSVSIDGSANVTLTATVAADSVALGTDTTGQYVSDVTGTANQIVATPTGTEPRTIVLSTPQNIDTAATPTFGRLTLTQATGTAPMVVASTTKVANLNADLLDDRDSTYFATQSGLESVLGDLLYVGLIDVSNKTITNKALTSNVATLSTSYAHGFAVNDRVAVRGVDATFNGDVIVTSVPAVTNLTITFRQRTTNVAQLTTSAAHGYAVGRKVNVNSSDSTFNGIYDVLAVPTSTTFTYRVSGTDLASTATTGTTYAYPTSFSYAKTAANVTSVASGGTTYELPIPIWNGATTSYRHGMYWIVSKSGNVDFVDADLSGRYEIGVDAAVDVANGDWIIATYPSYNPANPNVTLTYADMVFQVLPFSAETYVKAQIGLHADSVNDPHSAAGYLTSTTAGYLYAPIVHQHTADISAAITNHKAETDPHPIYLTSAEGALAYASITHTHPSLYEPIGLVAAHEAKADPHAQYLTQTRGDARYTLIGHSHNDLYYTKAQVDATFSTLPAEIKSTDGASSSRMWVGDITPTPNGVGDLWVETTNIALVPPPVVPSFSLSSPNGTTVNLSWTPWPTTQAVTNMLLQRQNGSDWTTLTPVQLVNDNVSFAFSDTGRSENTQYKYRIRATNAAGAGPWSADFTIITANDAPGAPTGLTVSGQTPTGFRLSWTAPSPFPDPNAAGSRYEAFLNGVSQGYALTTNTYFDFGSNGGLPNLVENTTYSVTVRARDTGGLFSPTSTAVNAVTTNAAPPSPTGQNSSNLQFNQVTLTWNAVTGISDFLRYRVYLNNTEVATTTGTSHTFTGLSGSTAYNSPGLEVRAEDQGGLLSTDNVGVITVTTPANPDTTPPNDATITSFKPESSYGQMWLRGSWPSTADFNFGQIQTSTNNADWTNVYNAAASPSGAIALNVGTFSAGQTAYCRVNVRDATGNWRYGPSQNYSLVESPYTVAADASNQWRNTNGGAYGDTGNSQPYQWYYSNAAFIARGLFYYGTKPQDQLQYGGRRTIVSGRIFLIRANGVGASAAGGVGIMLHSELYSPGTVSGVGAPNFFGTNTVVASLTTPVIGGSTYQAWGDLPSNWANDLVQGTYRGIGIYTGSGPYLALQSVSANGYSGVLEFTHLG